MYLADVSTECSSCHLYFPPDDDWSIQSKCRQVISKLKLVTEIFLFIYIHSCFMASYETVVLLA